MINNIVIIIKKIIGGKYAMLLGDFALESSENFNSIFLKINSAASIAFKTVVAQSFFVWFQQVIYHFEGILMKNVKLKITIFLNLLILTHFARTGHI